MTLPNQRNDGEDREPASGRRVPPEQPQGADAPRSPNSADAPRSPTSEIGRRTAAAMAAGFLMLIGVPAVWQTWFELRSPDIGRCRFLSLFDEIPTAASLKAFEMQLARDSEPARMTRVPCQGLLTDALRLGNDKVVVGADGHLLFRKEIELARGHGFLSERFLLAKRATAANPDPLPAIVDFHRRLAERGIHLLVVPVPVKPIVQPEAVWSGYPMDAGPARNPDHAEFFRRLADSGVDALDMTNDLWNDGGRGPFLRLDTHWRPEGQALAAETIAERVRAQLGDFVRREFETREVEVANHGDLFNMLELPEDSDGFPKQRVTVTQVLRNGEPAAGGDDAPVLLLGDSFTNIYDDPGLKWGTRAGLGGQLMLRLGTDVQIIARNGGGATAVRKALAGRPAALAGKKVVVWEFSMRELIDESVSWDPLPLPPAVAPDVPAPSSVGLVVIGELLTPPPAINLSRTPYTDAVVILKFRIVRVESGRYEKADLLAAMPIVRNRVLQPPAGFKIGRRFRLTLADKGPPGSASWQRFDDTGEFDLPEMWAAEVRGQ